MPSRTSDLLMKLVQGEAVRAEGSSALDSSDSLLEGFAAGKFFEIESFRMGLALQDSEAAGSALNPATAQRAAAQGPRPAFASWRDTRNKTQQQIAQITYPVTLEPFTVVRQMDRASPILFQNCCNSISFDSATVVKRKVAGANLQLQGFLRIDFTDVLIVGVEWLDGPVMRERCRLISRGVKVQYKRQNNDGTLGAASPASWTRDMATRTSAS